MEVLNQHGCNIGGFVTSNTFGMRLRGIVHVENEERRAKQSEGFRVAK